MITSAKDPNIGGKVPHLLLEQGDIGEIVLLPGNPDRVEMFAELCDDFKIIAHNREYKTGVGYYKGRKITVCSTGIGGPSAEIAIIELIELGAKALIRVGGTGVLKPEINCGDMIITTAAIRQGGASNFYAPPEYPAVASFEVIECLQDAAKASKVPYWKGISSSVGSFFAGQGRPAAGKKFYNENMIEDLINLNVVNMEMESETILTLGNLYDVYVGCLCAVHANRVTDEWMVDFEGAQIEMCKIALNASVLLYERHI